MTKQRDLLDDAGLDSGFRLVAEPTLDRPFVEPDTRTETERDRDTGQMRLDHDS